MVLLEFQHMSGRASKLDFFFKKTFHAYIWEEIFHIIFYRRVSRSREREEGEVETIETKILALNLQENYSSNRQNIENSNLKNRSIPKSGLPIFKEPNKIQSKFFSDNSWNFCDVVGTRKYAKQKLPNQSEPASKIFF